MTGTVSALYEPGMTLRRAGVVAGQDMTTEAALTKLSYLLALPGLTREDVTKQMSISLLGELTEQSQMIFKHPGDDVSSRQANLTRLGYAIADGDLSQVNEIMKSGPEWVLNEADYTGNTPLVRHLSTISTVNALLTNCALSQHLAATGPNLEILQLLLLKGASVHLRNKTGRTPLFLAANAGLVGHVRLLRASGAHLHAGELHVAELHAQQNRAIWEAAGI